MEEVGIDVPAHRDDEAERYVIDCPFPARFDAEAKRWLLDEGPIGWDEVVERWKGRGPMNVDYVDAPAARISLAPGGGGMSAAVEARLWRALQEVEDPEIPISVVGMGLIVSLAYRAGRARRGPAS